MATSTLARIKTKVRRLTASPNPSQLSEADLLEYINTYYEQDLPTDFKIWSLHDTWEWVTTPNVPNRLVTKDELETYHVIEGPVTVGGYDAKLYFDRAQWLTDWSAAETSESSATGTGIAGPYTWTLSTDVLPGHVTISATDTAGAVLTIEDDGKGNLVDFGTTDNRGTVNYTTGAVSVTFSNTIDTGTTITTRYVQHTPGRPVAVLWFNNTFELRPVPDGVYRVQVQVYRKPSDVLAKNSDEPQLKQWWQLIAFGAAIKVLQDRQDVDSIENILPFYEEQRQLLLHKTVTEQGQTRNNTIYADQVEQNYGYSWGGSWY